MTMGVLAVSTVAFMQVFNSEPKAMKALPGSTVRFSELGAYCGCCVLPQETEN